MKVHRSSQVLMPDAGSTPIETDTSRTTAQKEKLVVQTRIIYSLAKPSVGHRQYHENDIMYRKPTNLKF